jgi:hypothetical protein
VNIDGHIELIITANMVDVTVGIDNKGGLKIVSI